MRMPMPIRVSIAVRVGDDGDRRPGRPARRRRRRRRCASRAAAGRAAHRPRCLVHALDDGRSGGGRQRYRGPVEPGRVRVVESLGPSAPCVTPTSVAIVVAAVFVAFVLSRRVRRPPTPRSAGSSPARSSPCCSTRWSTSSTGCLPRWLSVIVVLLPMVTRRRRRHRSVWPPTSPTRSTSCEQAAPEAARGAGGALRRAPREIGVAERVDDVRRRPRRPGPLRRRVAAVGDRADLRRDRDPDAVPPRLRPALLRGVRRAVRDPSGAPRIRTVVSEAARRGQRYLLVALAHRIVNGDRRRRRPAGCSTCRRRAASASPSACFTRAPADRRAGRRRAGAAAGLRVGGLADGVRRAGRPDRPAARSRRCVGPAVASTPAPCALGPTVPIVVGAARLRAVRRRRGGLRRRAGGHRLAALDELGAPAPSTPQPASEAADLRRSATPPAGTTAAPAGAAARWGCARAPRAASWMRCDGGDVAVGPAVAGRRSPATSRSR